jgi:hypothetical protein
MKIKVSYAEEADVPAEHKALYTEVEGSWKLTEVDGIKTEEDIQKMNIGLTKERTDHKATKAKLAPWANMGDPAEVQIQLDRIPELEAHTGGKIDETKMNELVETRMRTKLAPMERDKKALEEQVAELTTENGGLKTNQVNRTIDDAVRSSAVKMKVIPEAMDDLLFIARNNFEISDGGEVITSEKNGQVGLSAETWLTDMKTKRPYLWPVSQGGGAQGSGKHLNGGELNPWSKAGWNLTKQGQLYKDKGAEVANQLATAAGSKVGSANPPEK